MVQIPSSGQAPVPPPDIKKVPKKPVSSKKRSKKMPKEAREPIGRYVIYGLLGTLILAVLGLISSRYYALTPLPLTIGMAAWVIKMVDRKYRWKKMQPSR